MPASLALLLALAAAPPPPSVSHGIAEQHATSIVRVLGKAPAVGVALGAGLVLAPASAVRGAQALLGFADGSTEMGRVELRSAEVGLVLLHVGRELASLPVASAARLKAGDWVVAVERGKPDAVARDGLFPVAGQVREAGAHLVVETPCAPGSPVFLPDGRLVAVALRGAPGHAVQAVSLDEVRAWYQKARSP